MKVLTNIFRLSISALVIGAALSGCTAIREDSTADGPVELRFRASVGTFQVKATDTAFEVGDAVGLFADAPVNARNVRMDWDGANLVPEERLFWMPGQERTTFFTAYYPYNADVTGTWARFCVNADQSTHELYTASDLMAAHSAQTSPDGLVSLEFYHALSKIVIYLENGIEGAEIADVYLSNVFGRYECDLANCGPEFYGNVIDKPGTIKAGKVVTAEGATAWTLIIPPQSVSPNLIVTTTDGRQYTGWPGSDIWFGPNTRYSVQAVLDGESVLTDFTAEVTEWTDNNDIAFPGYNSGVTTVSDVINGPEGEVYTVTGRVVNIVNSTYGNYYISDDTGELYIYGTKTPEGLYPRDAGGWYSDYFGLVAGDIVTVTGPKTVYGGTVELVDCQILDVQRAPIGLVRDWAEIPGTEYSFSVELRSAIDGLGVIDIPDWVHIDSVEQFEASSYGVWNRVYLVADANPDSVQRSGGISFTDNTGNIAWYYVIQGPAVVEYDSVKPVVDLPDGTFTTFSAIVHAVSTRGFMVYDGEYGLFVYTGSAQYGVSVGDMVKVSGTKSTYSDVPEILNTGLSIEIVSSGNNLYDCDYSNYTEYFAGGGEPRIADTSIPFSAEGRLYYDSSSAKYCLEIPGAQTIVQVYWPSQDYLALDDYVEKNVRLSGFYNGWNRNLTHIVVSYIEQVN